MCCVGRGRGVSHEHESIGQNGEGCMRIHICMPFECKQNTIQVFRRGGLQALVAMILMTIDSNLNPKTLDYPGNG